MASISDRMRDALNGQIGAEIHSSHLYLAMSAYFQSLDLAGSAHWMRVQAAEENVHVQKLFDFVVERGGRVILDAIARPPAEWESPQACFEAALEHERMISGRINNLINLARQDGDHASESFLRWFVDEQVEEEASVDRIIKMFRIGGGQPVALLMLDRELAARVLSPAAVAAVTASAAPQQGA